jgi:histidinol dehydrogenase
MMQRLDTRDTGFDAALRRLTAWHDSVDQSVLDTVDTIVEDVIARGDAALVEYTNRLDRRDITSADSLSIDLAELDRALHSIDPAVRTALEVAAGRIRDFHERQVEDTWSYRDETGTLLGQKITPLERVGVYVPGGKASYPSSVLMNIIPARVAGVDEIVMVVPAPDGEVNELVLAAASVAGADRVFSIGGAQAIAALAYGTETVPRVDKIVGPGNIYVASAKRRVFGQVGIDMVAGPSEIMVITDGGTPADWIAMDLFSQAEHDENAQSILVCPDAEFLEAVSASIDRLLPGMSRSEIIRRSLTDRGAMILCRDLSEAVDVANKVAPEHLELSVENPEVLLDAVRHAGAIFLGRYSAEALGDYCAGPNHVLPTSGTARFSSPLGVYDFLKRSSLIQCSREGIQALAPVASALARGESLEAHALSAEYRLEG